MRPTHYDGMLEVVGVTGVMHMGQISSGIRSAIRVAQGGHVSLPSSVYSNRIVAVLFHDTIRYGRLTCAQKLTRWPA